MFMILVLAVDDVLDTHKYLMKKKRDIIQNVWVYKVNICFSNVFWL